MNTVTEEFINRRPQVEIKPDAEYTCTNCFRRHKVSESGPEEAKGFTARVVVRCRSCGRHLILVSMS